VYRVQGKGTDLQKETGRSVDWHYIGNATQRQAKIFNNEDSPQASINYSLMKESKEIVQIEKNQSINRNIINKAL
jgi:hypothetical protein